MTSSDKRNNDKQLSREPFSQFMHTIDLLFSEKPVKGMLQSLDDFFGSMRERSFPTEFFNKPTYYLITASLPGIKKEQINIELLPQAVTITITHTQSETLEHPSSRFFHRKQGTSTVTKTLHLPTPINEQSVTASHRNGILQLKLPKLKGNKINIHE